MDFNIPTFKHDKDLFDFIVKNEEDIVYSRKQAIKKADGLYAPCLNLYDSFKSESIKSFNSEDKDYIDVQAIINTTKILDSYRDVHIDSLWDKSLAENFRIKFLQEHKMAFDKVIADKDDLKAYTKEYTWKQLGYNAAGKTEALVFEARVRKDRNPFMFKQYAEGNVDNHSVGMRYMKMVTCINDEDYGAQYEAWEKYAPMVVNQKDLENVKYFWAVTEAKIIEGSAVPLGANPITPTNSVKGISQKPKQENKSSLYLNWLAK